MKKQLATLNIGIGIVLNEYSQLLIAQRLDTKPMGGLWEFPGGKQKKDESIETTIVREIKEETNIDVLVGEKLIELDHLHSHKKFHFVVYICEFVSGHHKPLASKQILWIFPDELCNYPFPSVNTHMIKALNEYLLTKQSK